MPVYFSAVGFVNGAVRVLDSITLQDEVSEPFRYARDAITHIEFSHDSKYLATAVSKIFLLLKNKYNTIVLSTSFRKSFFAWLFTQKK